MIATAWRSRHLIAALTARQYTLRYRQSFAGLLWALVSPLAILGVGTMVFRRVVGVGTGEIPYALFTLSAVVPWTFFASGVNSGVTSVVQSKGMVQKLPFPKVVLPLSLVGNALIDLAIAAGIFVVASIALGHGLPISALWTPVLLLIEIALVLGLSLFGGALNVFARDIRLGLPLLIQMWLLVTPVMYPLSSVPERYRDLYLLNPMTGLVEAFRTVLVQGRAPDVGLLVPAMVGAAVSLLIGVWYFTTTEKRFADAI